MKLFFAALQFMTIIPVPTRYYCGEEELKKCVIFFPVVGLLLGGMMAGLDWGLGYLLPPLPASAMVVVFMTWITGFMHMDGLADTADGFLSARPKEKILEIMRDSRVGAMGAIVIACALILKISAVASVPGSMRWFTLLLMPFSGRVAQIISSHMLPYARTGSGMAAFTTQKSSATWIVSLALYFLVAWLCAGVIGLVGVVVVIFVTVLFSIWCKRMIGGYTGDTLGAVSEFSEIATALVFASWAFRHSLV